MRPLQHLLASNLLVPQNKSFEHSRLEELDSTKFSHKERWQSGRMRVFAKDVTGQKLVHGFESRPLRFLTWHHNSYISRQPWHFLFKTGNALAQFILQFCLLAVFGMHCDSFSKGGPKTLGPKAKHRLCRIIFHHTHRNELTFADHSYLSTSCRKRILKIFTCRAHDECYLSRS